MIGKPHPSIVKLGRRLDSFLPSYVDVWAGRLIALFFIVGGLWFAIHFSTREEPRPLTQSNRIAKWIAIGFAATVPPAVGCVMIFILRRIATQRVDIHERGLSYLENGAITNVLWTEIEKISQIANYQELEVLKLPGGKIRGKDRIYVVHRFDGEPLEFTVTGVAHLKRLAKILESAAIQYRITWEWLTREANDSRLLGKAVKTIVVDLPPGGEDPKRDDYLIIQTRN